MVSNLVNSNFYCFSDSNKFLEEQVDNETLKEEHWATIVGIHVLRKLAVHNDMKGDSGNPDLFMGCPCGCRTPVNVGDNSIGNKFSFFQPFGQHLQVHYMYIKLDHYPCSRSDTYFCLFVFITLLFASGLSSYLDITMLRDMPSS